MTLEEALAWLNNERSSINYAYGADHGGKQVNAARMDASNMEQAYWVVRAHREGLPRCSSRYWMAMGEDDHEDTIYSRELGCELIAVQAVLVPDDALTEESKDE